MAQKAHDQAGLDAKFSPGVDDGAVEAFDHRREGNTAGRMSLRIEEHLDMPDVVGVGAFEIGPGKVVEILFRDQYRHSLVVEVEKVLQVSEPISIAQRVHRRIGKTDAVAARQCEHQLRLQAALDMNVQLAFGELFDQAIHVGHAVVSLSGVKSSAGKCARTQSSTSRGGRWRALGRRVKPATAFVGAEEKGSAHQRLTLAVVPPLGNEKFHGYGVIARS